MMACPAHTNARRYATLIAEGGLEETYPFARDPNPLASICRRVCGATWYLGAMTFGTFMILVITGVLLMLYYHPSVPQEYPDVNMAALNIRAVADPAIKRAALCTPRNS
jgi:quinol-cytochrome oxidoreductase complex cytochrome b subunit